MDKLLSRLILGTCLLIAIIIAFYFFIDHKPVSLPSKLGNRIASVLPHADMSVADYDDTFIDPHSEKISSGGSGDAIWEGTVEDPKDSQRPIHLKAVTNTTGWLETQCDEPSTAIGIHFWGDDNDGWAKVIIDNDYEWTGDIWNENQYVEISSLPKTRHTIRVEARGDKGNDGNGKNIHVTVAGIDCAPINTRGVLYRVFLPLIWG